MQPDITLTKNVLDYVRREFGEESGDPTSLSLDKLMYEGEQVINDQEVHCWSFPSSKPEMWATALVYENGDYELGMVVKPFSKRHKHFYDKLGIVIETPSSERRLAVNFGKTDKNNWETEEQTIEIDKNHNFLVLCTISFSHNPPMISLYIDQEDESYNIFGSFAITSNITLKPNACVYFEVGDIDATFPD